MNMAMEAKSTNLEYLNNNFEEYVKNIKSLSIYIENYGNTSEASDAHQQARLFRELGKFRKVAHEVAMEAFRLECIALRRLGQLGQEALKILGTTDKDSAHKFAKMSSEDFEFFLTNLTKIVTPATAFKQYQKMEQDKQDFEDGVSIGRGNVRRPSSYDEKNEQELMEAAAIVLNNITSEEFTIASAAQALGERIQRQYDDEVDRVALKTAIRVALFNDESGHGNPDAPELLNRCPELVTYFESEVGWVRIPRERASVEQFKFMVEYRERQAEAMLSAAKELRVIFDEVQAKGVSHLNEI